jgi:ribosome-associated protein
MYVCNRMEKFKIKGEMIHLNQLLKILNWCENGAVANAIIEQGLVKVNGKTELRKRNKLTKGMIVSYQKKEVEIE